MTVLAPLNPDDFVNDELEFEEVSHVYHLDGERIPSVTGILSPLNSFENIPKAILNRKRDLGIALHKAIELHLLDDLVVDSLHEDVKPYFDGYLKFEEEAGFEADLSELRVFSRKFHYSGTLDLIGRLKKAKRVLIDTKSVASLSCSVGPQLAAYEHAFKSMYRGVKIDGRYALHLKPDGTYRLPEYKDKRDFDVFKSCLNIYRWKNGF